LKKNTQNTNGNGEMVINIVIYAQICLLFKVDITTVLLLLQLYIIYIYLSVTPILDVEVEG